MLPCKERRLFICRRWKERLEDIPTRVHENPQSTRSVKLRKTNHRSTTAKRILLLIFYAGRNHELHNLRYQNNRKTPRSRNHRLSIPIATSTADGKQARTIQPEKPQPIAARHHNTKSHADTLQRKKSGPDAGLLRPTH